MKLPVTKPGLPYIAVTDDSREAGPATAFLAESLAAKYAEQAKAAGAPILTIDDFLSLISLDGIQIVGITGTNGKTTTAALIYSLLLDLGHKPAMQGTRGFFIGEEKVEGKSLTTPMLLGTYAHILRAKEAGCDFFIMEVSSHAIAQERIKGLPFALKIHTNITQDHLDFHGTFENYRRVKNSFLADETPKLVNKDDKELEFNYHNAHTYAVEGAGHFKLEAYSMKEGLQGVVRFFDEVEAFHSPMVGLFNLSNLLGGIGGVKMLTKRPLKEICEAVENFGGVAGRTEKVSDDPLVVVDFAHTPDGMEKVLEALSTRPLVCVFGAGGDRDAGKRPLMGRAAFKFCRRIYITSDNPRSEDPDRIIDQIEAGIPDKGRVEKITDRREAIRVALENLKPGEILAVLGRGDEEVQEVAGRLLPFNDKETILSILSERKQ